MDKLTVYLVEATIDYGPGLVVGVYSTPRKAEKAWKRWYERNYELGEKCITTLTIDEEF